MRGPTVNEQSDGRGSSVNGMLVDYSEYEWMGGEDLEKFDQQMLDAMLEEDQFYEKCIEELEEHFTEELGEYQLEEDVGYLVCEMDSIAIRDNCNLESAYVGYYPTLSIDGSDFHHEDSVLETSTLNPDAPEFVPRWLNVSATNGNSTVERPPSDDEPNH